MKIIYIKRMLLNRILVNLNVQVLYLLSQLKLVKIIIQYSKVHVQSL